MNAKNVNWWMVYVNFVLLLSTSILKFEDCWSKETNKKFAFRFHYKKKKIYLCTQVKCATPVEYMKTCLGYEIWTN